MKQKKETLWLEEQIAVSEFFDAEFYSARYMLEDGTPLDAANHYNAFGRFDTRAPSALFDSYQYLAKHQDVLLHTPEMAPLSHYILHGRSEDRKHSNLADRYPFLTETVSLRDVNTASATDLVESRQAKIALTIHAFYIDHFARYLEQLRSFRYSFDIFITAPEKNIETVDAFVSALKASSKVRTVKVAVCQNRGRNFGPLLVEFSKALRDYDIIGHIHSKKSLYTGGARFDLAYRSTSAVLGDPDYIRAVFSAMLEGTVGLVAAEKDPNLPYWAYHWLKNKHARSELIAKLGLSESTETPGFLIYPVGGMFWATQKVLEPLLQCNWSYDDFPEETGQTDGTIHHAVERLIGELAERSGSKILRWAPDIGAFYFDKSPGLSALKSVSLDSIELDASSTDIASFDIFDTLVYRTVADPNDVRDSLEVLCSDYREIRANAELLARSENRHVLDVGIKDIALAMSKLTGRTLLECFELLDHEFRRDLATFKPRKSVVSLVGFLKSLGKRVIYVSDMYYDADQVARILDACEIPLPDRLYLSSAEGVRKDSGELWSLVRRLETGSIVHFGDNMVSDVQNASDAGIRSVYLPSIQDKCLLLGVLSKPPNKQNVELLMPLIEFYGDMPFFC